MIQTRTTRRRFLSATGLAAAPNEETSPTGDLSHEVHGQLDTIVGMLDKRQKGALLQVGHSNLPPEEIKEKFDALSPSRKKAWQEYFHAKEALRDFTDREAYGRPSQ